MRSWEGHRDMRRRALLLWREARLSCAWDMMAAACQSARGMRHAGVRTGGSALPRGIGCGATAATGADDAVSAQNQPMVSSCGNMEVDRVGKTKECMRLK
jgi:hypothetical protein